jgi:hypothetical protein
MNNAPTTPKRGKEEVLEPQTARKQARRSLEPSDDDEILAEVEFKHLRDGSALLVTPRADATIEALTGEALVKPALQVKIEPGTEEEQDKPDNLNVFDYRKVNVELRGGVHDTKWMPEVRYKVAVAMGYKTCKEMLQAVVEPVWRTCGILVHHVGEPVCLNYKLTYSWNAGSTAFKIRGTTDEKATASVHPHIINWKEYKLQYKEPFWRNMTVPYDPRPLVRRLQQLEPMITIQPTPKSDDIDLEGLYDSN